MSERNKDGSTAALPYLLATSLTICVVYSNCNYIDAYMPSILQALFGIPGSINVGQSLDSMVRRILRHTHIYVFGYPNHFVLKHYTETPLRILPIRVKGTLPLKEVL